VLHTLFYANEVRADEEYTADSKLVNPKELDLAKLVVGALATKFDPTNLRDAFEERLREFIRERADTGMAAYEHVETAKPPPVVDILEALRKSLEMARKPPQREEAAKASKAIRTPAKRARRSHS
jgi:DNA end-binding protein Ku